MADSLIIKFGGDTSEFRGALASMAAETQSKFTVMDAAAGRSERSGMGASLRGLHHGVREFHALLTAGGSATLIKEFFHTAIEYAEHTKETLDDNTAAVLRFKDSLKGSGEFFGHMAAEAVGFLNRIGEAEGSLRRGLFEYITGNKNAFKEASDEVKSAGEAGRNIAKMEAEKKKHGEEYKRINTEITSEHEKQKSLANSNIPAQERSIKLAKEYQRLVSERGTEGGLEGRKKDLEIEKARTEARKAAKDAEKEGRTEEKKADEHKKENIDAAQQMQEHMNHLKEHEHKLAVEEMPYEERVAALAKERARLENEIASGGHDEETTLENQIKLHEIIKQQGHALTAQMKERQALVEAQNEATGKQNLLLTDQLIIMGKIYGASRDPNQIEGASDASLQDLIKKNKAEIAKVMASAGTGATALTDTATGNLIPGSVAARLQTDVDRAQFQLDQRAKLRSDFAAGGEAQARQNFGGDSLQFEALLRQANVNQDNTKQLDYIGRGIESINKRLHVAGWSTIGTPGQGSY